MYLYLTLDFSKTNYLIYPKSCLFRFKINKTPTINFDDYQLIYINLLVFNFQEICLVAIKLSEEIKCLIIFKIARFDFNCIKMQFKVLKFIN